ncbi:pescadillo-related [Euphorbia peplus]|nr:pescadillo-related [Euphorbia peplus]
MILCLRSSETEGLIRRRLRKPWERRIKIRLPVLNLVNQLQPGYFRKAEVEGQTITWLTPRAMQQVMPEDVNYSVMLTFVELYRNLLGFVNCRLYHTLNLEYPPILDPQLEALAACLYALSRYIDVHSSRPMESGAEAQESEVRLAQLQHQLPSNEPGALMPLVQDTTH